MNIAFSKSKTVTSEQHNSEIADWKDVALEDVTSEITVGYVGPMASEYIEKGIPFLRSQNVDFLRVNTKDIKHITPKFHDRLKKSALKPGDVVIVRTGKPGTCSVIPAWLPVANCSDLVIVRCSDKLNADFLSYYVNSVSSYHVATHLVGAVQQHFNVESARKIRLKLPPIEEQKVISEFLGTRQKN
jgi:type I restriction enzyme S subunit